MSFHAYLRKLTGGADKWGAVFNFPVWLLIMSDSDTVLISCRGKFAALENISCKIKSGCEGHPPWPEGICTKCQPSAITLNRQVCHGNKCWEKYSFTSFISNYDTENTWSEPSCPGSTPYFTIWKMEWAPEPWSGLENEWIGLLCSCFTENVPICLILHTFVMFSVPVNNLDHSKSFRRIKWQVYITVSFSTKCWATLGI